MSGSKYDRKFPRYESQLGVSMTDTPGPLSFVDPRTIGGSMRRHAVRRQPLKADKGIEATPGPLDY